VSEEASVSLERPNSWLLSQPWAWKIGWHSHSIRSKRNYDTGFGTWGVPTSHIDTLALYSITNSLLDIDAWGGPSANVGT